MPPPGNLANPEAMAAVVDWLGTQRPNTQDPNYRLSLGQAE